MSISNLVLLLACGVSVAYATDSAESSESMEFRRYSADQMNEEIAKDVGFCIGQILCVEKKPEILQEMLYAADYPELYEIILEAYRMTYKVNATDTDEWWRTGPYETACHLTLAEQTYLFSEWATIVSEDFTEENCEAFETPKCDGYFKMLTFGEDTIIYYKEIEICTDENYAKRTMEDQEKSKEVMKKMGFLGRR